jgi:hypothetical protein
MPVAPEVDSLQREVGRDQQIISLILASAQKSQHGAVVSNSSDNGWTVRGRCQASNLGNQRFFRNHHGHQYKRRQWSVGRKQPLAIDH